MFPTLSHIIEYLTGIYVPLPVQTFGLFVAFAFFAAYWVFSKELERKEKEGLIKPIYRRVTIGERPNIYEIITNALVGFIIGYKLLYAVLNYRLMVDDPQGFLLSLAGNFFGGLILAALFGYWAYAEKKRNQLSKPKEIEEVVKLKDLMGKVLLWAAIWGLIGAKLFHNLEYWDEFVNDPITGLLSFSGLTFYGGVIFGGIAVIYYTGKQGIKPLHMLDIGAPGIMLGYAIGRLGCQLSGDGDWGINNTYLKPTWLGWAPDWVWAFKFPHNVINAGVPIADCTGKFCHELPLPVYPTSFYEFLMCMFLFAVLWLLRKRIRTAGILFCIYLLLNGIERFLIELIRVNSKYHVLGIRFTQAEFISLLMIISAIIGISYAKSYAERNPDTVAPKYV
ncbi:prolipoprotein diacylglyceryl transferase [Olivibacter sp. SDN3]|uniref:prolipoprotein diacylglyceryl transferase n=1 Tax=Olivibacter sp. SDN3 TaxID=2764720 RepID=UPI0016517FE1|nr:prolipoprotein diacylglyceryl transferase family protein [Olivibacter sp. SDN3]QNL48860.1 prolipoprotein diacylglyceryl transferase [Olivibacter sp. SDN3]